MGCTFDFLKKVFFSETPYYASWLDDHFYKIWEGALKYVLLYAFFWWCPDEALMMYWWRPDDALRMPWWCTDDAMMVHRWWQWSAFGLPPLPPLSAMVSICRPPPSPGWRDVVCEQPLRGGGGVIPRHDICQICYTSLFPKIQKFTRRKHADRDISSPLVWQFRILKLELYPNILLAGSLNTLSLAYMTEYYQKQNDSYINCSKSTFKM